ncbi:MAG: ABC transporter permease [Dehalococcoidales bacterium]|nr:ABC transporter permease [Dehalococcoidales bacterium]
MKLYQIVLKDIMRRKRRVLYAALGVVIGTMTVVGVLTIAFAGENRIYGQLEKYGANLTIIPAISRIDTKVGNLSLGTLSIGENYISESYLPKIREIADGEIRTALNIKDNEPISIIAPKLYVNAEVRGISLVVTGIQSQDELSIKTWWQVREGEFLKTDNQAVVGALTAELLKLKVGDGIPLNKSVLVVSGILEETGSSEDYQVMVPLATLQKAYNKEGLISSVEIRALCNACPVELIALALNQNIPGIKALAVKQIANTEMDLVQKVNRLMLSLAGITLVIGVFGVVNTMMTSVHERTRDIGIMRAVGASRWQIIQVFMYEALVIGVIGGVLGYLAGTLLAYGIGPLIFESASISYIPQFIPLSLGIAVAVAAVATVYPALRATRIRIAEAFRSL